MRLRLSSKLQSTGSDTVENARITSHFPRQRDQWLTRRATSVHQVSRPVNNPSLTVLRMLSSPFASLMARARTSVRLQVWPFRLTVCPMERKPSTLRLLSMERPQRLSIRVRVWQPFPSIKYRSARRLLAGRAVHQATPVIGSSTLESFKIRTARAHQRMSYSSH